MKNRKLFAIITLVAFMLTMMPVMAFAVGSAGDFYIDVEDGTAKADGIETLEYTLVVDEGIAAMTTDHKVLAVYATRNDNYADDVTFTMKGTGIKDTTGNYIIRGAVPTGTYTITASSTTAGTIAIRAYLITVPDDAKVAPTIAQVINGDSSLIPQPIEGNGISGKFNPTNTDITVTGTVEGIATNKDPESQGTVTLKEEKTVDEEKVMVNLGGNKTFDVNADNESTIADNEIAANNGVSYYDFSLQFFEGEGKLRGEDVDIYVNKIGATVNKETVTTNTNGRVDFKVSASKPGTYIVTVDCGNFSQDFQVEFTGTVAVSAEFSYVVADTIAVDETTSKALEIKCYDGLNNVVDMTEEIQLQLVSVPEDSSLDTDEDIADNDANVTIDRAKGKVSFKPDAAGTYRFKVYNTTTGVAAYATVNAAEFGVVDHATISYPYANYALGATTGNPTVKLVDKDGVVKDVKSGLDYSYAGAGVEKFNAGVITFSDDKDYAGQEITVSVVVNGRYAASTTMTIGVKPAAINFTEASGQAAKDIKVTGQLVDLNGNNVALSATDKINVQSAVVISRPEGALVSVDYDDDVFNKDGEFIKKGLANIIVTSNKEGTVQVNLVVAVDSLGKRLVGDEEVEESTLPNNGEDREFVADYYVAGVATITVGEYTGDVEEANDIVTFVIGTNTFIANNKATTSDVAPYIVDGRTFIPVRAFVEATGASVEFDAATQVVTIKGDGIDAQMTIGSNILTVNGETVVMDTAAAIKDGRTVLPVRYAGQAIGYDFECAYGANGAVTAVTMFK